MFDINESDFKFHKAEPKQAPVIELTPMFVSPDYSYVSGWLLKQSFSVSAEHTYRYVVLTDNKFKYYPSATSKTPTGILNFNQLTTTIAGIGSTSFLIEFHSCSYQFIFKAENFEERQIWLAALNHHILTSEAGDNILTTISRIPNFWRSEWISDFWFENNSSTGDILLFKSKALSSSLQRSLWNTYYDSIGLLLCYASGKILVLEATEKNGVRMMEWSDFLNKNLMTVYTKIGLRKLQVERDERFLMSLSHYLENINNCAYKRSARRARRGNHNWPGAEKYGFCAQIIANAYKAVGILDMATDVDKLWPVNFEVEEGLPLLQASFGPVMRIEFDL
ncbi:hypothetical protein SteCoe_8440 [Stentor coeruleus]|uniref:PH domain-containing protein n=1 Tax=Stentor coeruleus TaxID=5963 RepID=A0A1R2CKH1_9CILI|nr:hypothetical protein SteCoe_8440 [Stentor coeruleus]